MIDLEQVKVTPRDQQVAASARPGLPQTGNRGAAENQPENRIATSAHPLPACRNSRGKKRVKLAIAMFGKGEASHDSSRTSHPQGNPVATLVWEALTNCGIGRIIGTSEQVIRNHLRNIFDKLGVWSRLELAV